MRRSVLVVRVAVTLAGFGAGLGDAQAPQKVVFALNWFAVGDHAAYWVAVDKGYYKAKGLDVELQNSKGSGDSIAKVDTNRADIGLADAVVVIPRVAQGARIKIVGAVFDLTPLNIWTRKDTGITKPKDLEGKLLAAPPGDSQRQLFPAFAKINGVDAAKVKWSIIASEKTMKERAKVLRDFLEASYMGWRDVMADPKTSLEIFKKRVPDIDLALIEPNMMLGLDLMKTERYAKNGIGWMERGKMCRTVEFINTYMPYMPRKVACDEAYSGEYLTRIDPPKK